MKTYYQADGWIKFGEEDIYQEGCQPGTAFHYGGSDIFTADTVPELIEKLQSFVGSDNIEDCLLDSGEEDGRLDIQVLEDKESRRASENQIEQWKKGKIKLYLSTYTFHIFHIKQTTPILKEYMERG